MEILDNQSMREADRITIEEKGIPSLTLMERAGWEVAHAAREMVGEEAGRITVVCGKGNNGGDGLVAARRLLEANHSVSVCLLAPADQLSPDARANLARARDAGVEVEQMAPDELGDRSLRGAVLVVDAIFGTGLTRPAKAPWDAAIRAVNDSGARVLAVDVPSGLSGDTGTIPGEAIRAERTVALQVPKWPHVLYPAHAACGTVYASDIGISREALTRVSIGARLITSRDAVVAFPPRPLDSHKGTFGRLLVVAGSRTMPGALSLAVDGALQGGAGLVTIGSVSAAMDYVAVRHPDVLHLPLPETEAGGVGWAEELSARLEEFDAVLVGPGLGRGDATAELVLGLVEKVSAPLVVDADGLNALAERQALERLARRPGSTVITPHPGEMRRLLEAESGPEDRVARARDLASRAKVVVVYKGHRTLVAAPSGEVAVCPTGSPALARGGTGDVLSGFLASILARGIAPLDAAAAAVHLHGLAGELLARERGEHMVPAGSLSDGLSAALTEARTRALARRGDDDAPRRALGEL